METDIPLIISIFATMALSAFFSGMEIAFVSSNRMLAEMDKERNGFSQKLISVFYRHPNGFVSTMLVGNNIVLVVYGILIAQFFDSTIFRGMDVGFTVPADTILSTHHSFHRRVSSQDALQEQRQPLVGHLCAVGLCLLCGVVAYQPLLHAHIEVYVALGRHKDGQGKRRRGLLKG